MSHRTSTLNRTWKERALSLLLAAVLLLGLAPALSVPASAHWADSYLDQLVDWGVIRADQTGNPDAPITRADFAAVINRAYGYTETGPIPFTDVSVTDWFYDDIAIAYNAGYMAGTSATTASPNEQLTREMAVCILGRNMMMKETTGETLAFTDGRNISNWARGLVKTAVDNYIISGYPDNSFGPKDPISKAQMAVLVSQCLGQPIQESGSYSLGGVFGNVTITSPDVTLRDTTISGDLYVSGGVGLGGIKLENVKVLGRIIVSGTGESQAGDASVVMRNVTANEMLVDNMRNKTVTIRADGITEIGQTTVRTNAYLEDNNTDDEGLMNITLDGEAGTHLTLAGRIKEVVNKTPDSTVQVAKGSVAKLTVDEAATGSTVQIDRNTEVKELNLDVATNVTGEGDIEKLNVNAPGCVVSMLPDDIYIRPGLEANIAGVIMDYTSAMEGSTDPRLLSGYPAARDVTPTGFRADFSGNKQGTVYWGVSPIADGSVDEEDLISPPSYGNKAVSNGSIAAPTGGTVVNAQVTGLTVGGSYYLSAILVDGQDRRSPVKVVSFTTPDNTVPAFAQGYPYMSLITDTEAQVTIMPTKDCKMYYAVLPRGAQAPTADEMKAAAVRNNLGYGVVDVQKNKEEPFMVSRRLEELKDYTLYLWLSDGINSSAIIPVQFTTKDMTPPVVDPDPYMTVVGQTNVTLSTGMNEAGTIFWAVVPQGTPYPLPNNQSSPPEKDNVLDPDTKNPISAKLDSEYAKIQVTNGRNARFRGQVAVANPDNEVTFNVTGLAQETSYDLYYVGRDAAGNYSEEVKKITINTLDNTGPIVRQYFSTYQGDDETQNPMADSDIILQFSENITIGNSRDVVTLYEIANGIRQPETNLSAQTAKELLKRLLTENFKLKKLDITTNQSSDVLSREEAEAKKDLSWVDYEQVVVRSGDDSTVEVVFPGGKAVSMSSGSRYYFELTNIRDNSDNHNTTVPTKLNYEQIARVPESNHILSWFDTVFAQVDLAPGDGISQPPVWVGKKIGVNTINEQGKGQTTDGVTYAQVDTSFVMTPRSTQNADPNTRYEIIFFADALVDYDVYYRLRNDAGDILTGNTGYKNNWLSPDKVPVKTGENGANGDEKNGWVYLGNKQSNMTARKEWDGMALNKDLNEVTQGEFPYLTQLGQGLHYEFAISVTNKDNLPDRRLWNGEVNFRAYVVASGTPALESLTSRDLSPQLIADFDKGVTTTTGRSIGVYGTGDFVPFQASFVDSLIPTFTTGPSFTPGDTFVDVNIALNRPATIYYVVAPKASGLDAHVTARKDVANTATGSEPSNAVKANESLQSLVDADKEKFWNVIRAQTKTTDPGKRTGQTTDDAEGELEYYTVDNGYPPSLNIANGAEMYPTYISGTFDYVSQGVQDKIVIGGADSEDALTPNSDYYIYMVVRGASTRPSKVYIYTFKTDFTARPKIALNNQGNGTVRVSTTNDPAISANIDYALFTASELNAIRLDGRYIFRSTAKMFDASHTYSDTDPSAAGIYKDYTVLQALTTTYTGGPDSEYGSSVFDVYAKQEIKEQVAALIREGQSQQPILGSIATAATGTDEQRRPLINATSRMRPGEYYYLLAVGRHVSGVTDGFKAAENVVVPDEEPPVISFMSTEGEGTATATPTFEGTVTITFNKPLYCLPSASGSTRFAVLNNKSDVADSTGTNGEIIEGGKGILNVIGASGSLSLPNNPNGSPPAETTAGTTFRLGFTNWREGSTITFFNGGDRVANESGRSYTSALNLTLRYRMVASGTSGVQLAKPYFVATWRDANGVERTYTEPLSN